MSNIGFLEADAICLILLIWIIVEIHTKIDRRFENILFKSAVILVSIMIVSDAGRRICNGIPGTIPYIFNSIFSASFYAVSGFAAATYLLFLIVENMPDKRRKPPRILRDLPMLPIVFLSVISICSIWTGWLFSISKETNVREHGPLYFFEPAITYAFFALTSIFLIVKLVTHRYDSTQAHNRRIIVILLVASGIVHLFITSTATIWLAISVSIVLIYMELQIKQISLDELTNVNNRRSFNNYLNLLVKEERQTSFSLLMCDIDLFKQINDRYGHVEGDYALSAVASILKEQCANLSETELYIARFGGDEFAIICTAPEPMKMSQKLKDNIRSAFTAHNTASEKSYKIKISIGIAEAEPSLRDPKILIAKADKALYEEKGIHHKKLSKHLL